MGALGRKTDDNWAFKLNFSISVMKQQLSSKPVRAEAQGVNQARRETNLFIFS
jgi:hypothetical protein